MNTLDRILKRSFDFCSALLGLVFLWPLVLICAVLAARDTGASGIFRQTRVGRNAREFTVYKIRTMKNLAGTSVTTANDSRITELGTTLRKYKLDELPQLWNVLIGDMSLVGPRPDVPGYADTLADDQRELLALRPGITGPATLKYRDEETLLSEQRDPENYNRHVIWPDKVAINLAYLKNYTFGEDLRIIVQTVLGK